VGAATAAWVRGGGRAAANGGADRGPPVVTRGRMALAMGSKWGRGPVTAVTD
jgi:hypothetical protein